MNSSIHYKRTRSPTLHLTILISVVAFVTFLLISVLLKVEIVAEGQGKIVPLGRVQVVQPEFSGAVIDININSGDVVSQGDALIQLDATEFAAELATIDAESQRLVVEQKRIKSLMIIIDAGADEVPETLGSIVDRLFVVESSLKELLFFLEQRQLLQAEVRDYYNRKDQIYNRINVNEHSIEITQANIERTKASLQFKRERFKDTKKLVENDAKPEIDLLNSGEELLDVEKQLKVMLGEKLQQVSQQRELYGDLKTLNFGTQNKLLQRLSEIERRMAALKEQKNAAKRKVSASVIRAPVSGTVSHLNIFTIGGIAQSGEEVLRIVPQNIQMEFEGVISNKEFGMLKIGQEVNIMLDAFPSERFGIVKGSLSDVSADSIELNQDSGKWGFVVRVTPNEQYLLSANTKHLLKNGMTGRIHIVTGKRRLISYFFAPIVKTIQDSLGER